MTANVKAGGCAAKLGSSQLASLLCRIPVKSDAQLMAGIENFEDAAVYKISEDLAIIETVDFFPPLVDDPYLFGQIAAANAISDVYAMGGRPVLALNILCFPTCDYPPAVLEQILRGGADKVLEAGAVLAGGHSIQLGEPVYGLAVTGLVKPCEVLTNSGARPGDRLVLTKPIGTGVALLGLKGEQLEKQACGELLASLSRLNDKALSVARRFSVNALTDVTGFGLLGHVVEMAKASGLRARLETDSIEYLEAVVELAGQGFVPAGAYGNRQSFCDQVTYIKEVDLAYQDLLFDPQTSGGLLIAVVENEARSLVDALKDEGMRASSIGQFLPALESSREKVVLVEVC
ncbi:MAG: selenide, water dikinase SelD [Candidatus Obscuribacterales bacterium]|nr:selenide, water dikinase SelD [Candidatus Obscuribacterales bacterium]